MFASRIAVVQTETSTTQFIVERYKLVVQIVQVSAASWWQQSPQHQIYLFS